MGNQPLPFFLEGSFSFLLPDRGDLERHFGETERAMPTPQFVHLESEEATPMSGYPILMTEGLERLRQAFDDYLELEERAQVAIERRVSYDKKAYASAWGQYRTILEEVTENVITSSYGRRLPSIFWLYHSIGISRRLKEVPKRLVRIDLEIAREHGDRIKYDVFRRYIDRVTKLTYDVVYRIARETNEPEDELFPEVLTKMKDNLFILTEDYIGPNMRELAPYFNGYLSSDSRAFLEALERTRLWHREQLWEDDDLQAAVEKLLEVDPDTWGDKLLAISGYMSFLSSYSDWEPESLLSSEQVAFYESLLIRLKEYELLVAYRRLFVPVYARDDEFFCRSPRLRTTGIRPGEVRLSSATRPMDFLAPWVIEPRVERFGLIYDITDFSDILSILKRDGVETQYQSFRMVFSFQTRINRIAQAHRLHLEKYLGDGAFYSCRQPERALTVAVFVQRYYRQALEKGFLFDRGLRMALNYGEYRLLPLREGRSPRDLRYEFFGHGIVELSRLATGKSAQALEETRTFLISMGYSPEAVDSFFKPMNQSRVDLLDHEAESRDFHAYVNANGSLVNEGIVATEAFIEHLSVKRAFTEMHEPADPNRPYVVLRVEDAGDSVLVGLRKLGKAKLKGLGQLPVYEIVDAEEWPRASLRESRNQNLRELLDARYARYRAARSVSSR